LSEAPLFSRYPCAARVRGQESQEDLRTLVRPRLGQQHGHQRRVANQSSNAQRFAPAWVNMAASAV